jgi:parallel beta-helix repeat protein
MMLMLLLTGMLALARNIQPVKAGGTIYIRADGSIEGTDKIVTVDNVTYTFTGNIIMSGANGIVVERDNIVIDGAGYTLQGTGIYVDKGMDLSGRMNMTIRNIRIGLFNYGIYLNHSSFININCIGGSGIIPKEWYQNWVGIYLCHSFNNSISESSIILNRQYGIHLYYSSNNSIMGNNITVHKAWQGHGIFLESSYANIISSNNITNNIVGIYLGSSSNNTINWNNLSENSMGIWLESSNNNNINRNNITNNNYGIYSWGSASNNLIYHNNFVNNTGPAYNSQSSMNVWDDGYPSGGNYWSDYTGLDLYSGPYQNETGSDCLGDMPNVIDANNQDRYPLMAPFKAFEAGVWDRIAYDVDVLSNSTVSVFKFNVDQKSISFNVTGDEGTIGFCRVAIPKNLLWVDDGWTILVDSQLVTDYTKFEDENYTYLYFTYAHSTKTVTIRGTHVIPEYPLTLILALFMATTLIAVVVLKTKRKRQFP